MRYGIYYAYWEKEWRADYRKYVRKVKRLGFDLLEISCAPLPEMTREEARALRACAEEEGIALTAGYGPRPEQNLASPDPQIVRNGLEFWEKTFAVLEELGVKTVGGGLYSYWPADYTRPVDKAGDWERAVLGMRRLSQLADRHGIETLGMEVLNRHEGYLLNTAQEGTAFVREVDRGNVKVMLDTYHMNMEEDDFRQAILDAGPLLGHFHVGEANRRLPGPDGRMDWKQIGRALKETGYAGDVVMEPFVLPGGEVGRDIRLWRDLSGGAGEDALDQAAASSVHFLKELWKEEGIG